MPIYRPNTIVTSGNLSGSGLPNDPVGLKDSISISNFTASAPSLITVNSADAALRITQIGTGDTFIVEDSTNPDSTPFIIKNNGRVGIANTDPQTNFQVGDYDETGIKIGIVSSGSSFSEINFSRSGSVGTTAIDSYRGVVGYNHATGTLYFHQDGARAITISGSQNVGIGTSTPSEKLHIANGNIRIDDTYGIVFGTTASGIGGTSTVLKLDDYEYGTFSPVLSSSDGLLTVGSTNARYQKIGKVVHIQFQLLNINTGSNSTGASISIVGLPYAPYNSTVRTYIPINAHAMTTAMVNVLGEISSNSEMLIWYRADARAVTRVTCANIGNVTVGYLGVNCAYYTA